MIECMRPGSMAPDRLLPAGALIAGVHANGMQLARTHAARIRPPALRAVLRAVLAPLRVVAASLALGATLLGQVGDEHSCRADYRIRARVDVPEHTLSGEETILWKNESRDDVPDLWFHLYWNAFANNRSTHLARSRDGFERAEQNDEWGWQRVTSVQVGGVELLPSLRWRAHDDHNDEDRTVFSVQLRQAVKPGESVPISVRWESRIPRVRRRTGYKGDFLFIAQWFPKLGVYEAGNGWNCHQFHPSTEFFSDYGAYDVTLDLPAEYAGRIGASGVLVEQRVLGERVEARFVAPSTPDQVRADSTGKFPLVHDFTWTADPDYVVHERVFRYDEWAALHPEEPPRVALALGRGLDEVRLRDVDVTVLVHPEHAEQAERHFEATCTALYFYGLWWGEYPYEHVTVVDPAYGGGAAGGMEYPTLFTAGTRKFTRRGMMTPESVTVHECGHQFWYGLVGNNEFEASWLDEGFNTFSQSEALFRHYGLSERTTDFASLPFDGVPLVASPGGSAIADALALKKWQLPLVGAIEPLRESGILDWWKLQPMLSFGRMRDDPRAGDRSGYLSDPGTDPVDTPAWRYADRASYRTNSYRRTATVLRSLAGMVGWEPFLRGMRLYSERWRYAHPYPQDFFDAFEEGAQVDVAWFFDAAFRSTATVDWSVEVSQAKEQKPKGWFEDASGEWKRRSSDAKGDEGQGDDAQAEQRERESTVQASAPAVPSNGGGSSDGAGTARKKDAWRIDVMVRRDGMLLVPLKVELRYADGARETLTWSREEQARSTWWKPLEGRELSAKKLVSAVLDPDRVYYFDKDMSDNQWFEESDEKTPWRWSERAFTQYAHLLHWFGGIGG